MLKVIRVPVTALRQFFAQKGSVLNGFNGDATDNITLADSNIINGGIETIVTAGNKTGIHYSQPEY